MNINPEQMNYTVWYVDEIGLTCSCRWKAFSMRHAMELVKGWLLANGGDEKRGLSAEFTWPEPGRAARRRAILNENGELFERDWLMELCDDEDCAALEPCELCEYHEEVRWSHEW